MITGIIFNYLDSETLPLVNDDGEYTGEIVEIRRNYSILTRRHQIFGWIENREGECLEYQFTPKPTSVVIWPSTLTSTDPKDSHAQGLYQHFNFLKKHRQETFIIDNDVVSFILNNPTRFNTNV